MLPLWFPLACFATFGAIWGSFVAALCSRWPKGESVASGRSRCDGCGQTIAVYDLIPIFSYLLLRGKCRACGQSIAPDTIWIEILAVLAGVAPLLFLPPDQALALAILTWLLLPLAILDYRHLWLPNSLVFALAVGGLLFAPLLTPESTPLERLWGAVGGYIVLQSVRLLFFAIRKIEGMGAGDPKLFGALGIWLGWEALPSVLLLASMFGLARVLWMVIIRRRTTQQVAFGTMLALAAVVWFVGAAFLLSPAPAFEMTTSITSSDCLRAAFAEALA